MLALRLPSMNFGDNGNATMKTPSPRKLDEKAIGRHVPWEEFERTPRRVDRSTSFISRLRRPKGSIVRSAALWYN